MKDLGLREMLEEGRWGSECGAVLGRRGKLLRSQDLEKTHVLCPTQLGRHRPQESSESQLTPGHSWSQACCPWDLGRVSTLQRPVAPGLETLDEAKGSDIHLRWEIRLELWLIQSCGQLSIGLVFSLRK